MTGSPGTKANAPPPTNSATAGGNSGAQYFAKPRSLPKDVALPIARCQGKADALLARNGLRKKPKKKS